MPIYSPEPLESHELFEGFYVQYPEQSHARTLFKENLSLDFLVKQVQFVSPELARAIVLPHNFLRLDDVAREYIKRYADLGERLAIPVILFSLGDHSDSLQFDPRVKVVRLSVYRSHIQSNDVVMPTLTEDLGAQHFALRVKQEVPIVSFCGRAAFNSIRERVASWLRRLKYESLGILKPNERARIRGIFWRQWMMRACSNSTLVKTLFIVRNTFSGALRTIEVSPQIAREDFIQSIKESDFVLAPKGDGNHSNRFLEALSMGRIPVVVDTDMVLPFEQHIDYTKIMVRVPMDKVDETPRYISEFYKALGEEEWRERQELARQVFVEYLTVDAFFSHFFDTVEICVASPGQPRKV
ncbi:MAG: hypothetical protein QG621_539 [Patescibacteria group bacterium]|nr:hypothetical protein [Patescibacteria group bacterium]